MRAKDEIMADAKEPFSSGNLGSLLYRYGCLVVELLCDLRDNQSNEKN